MVEEYKDRLQQAMKDAGYTASKLADGIGATYQAVKKVLDGKSTAFSAPNNTKAAQLLGVSSDWLAAGHPYSKDRGASGTQGSAWPFARVAEKDVAQLPAEDLASLEGAMALVIAQLKLKVKVKKDGPKDVAAHTGTVAAPNDVDNPFPPPTFVEPKPWAVGLPLGSTVKTVPQLQISTQADVGHLASAGYSANDHQFLAVPELDVRLAAGTLGIENYSETQIGEIMLRKSFLESFGLPIERMKIVYGEGDSMEPVIRHRAPMLFFEEAITDRRLINPRMVYAINRGGKMLVKCLAKDMSGAWVARSLNPAHPDFPLEADDGSDVRIVGRILWSPYDLRNGVDERLVRR